MPLGRLATVALGSIALVTTSCALGERPTLAEPQPVDDEAASAVLDRLDRPPSFPFVASYSITPSSGTEPTAATVTRAGDGTLTIAIGGVVFAETADGQWSTCLPDGGPCDDFANDARISDLGITHRFWGSAFEQRLTTDSGRRIGISSGEVTTIAGQGAVCVAVKVPSSFEAVGIVTYCALDVGVLGRYYGADNTIELISFMRADG